MLVSSLKNMLINVVWRNQIDKVRLLFSKKRESYFLFYKILGFFPHDIEYYEKALMHKSIAVRSKKTGRLVNNERLEFLGDAILDAIVGDIVYNYFSHKHEGFLTNIRSKIVQRDSLNKLAVEIGLDKLIKCAPPSPTHNHSLCGNAFEALIGAIYLDRGYYYCKWFFEHKIVNRFIDLDKLAQKEVNFKSKLVEWSQKNRIEVSFELIEQFFDEHNNPIFQTEILIAGVSSGQGIGYSKKESQQKASEMAIEKIRTDKDFVQFIQQKTEDSVTITEP